MLELSEKYPTLNKTKLVFVGFAFICTILPIMANITTFRGNVNGLVANFLGA